MVMVKHHMEASKHQRYTQAQNGNYESADCSTGIDTVKGSFPTNAHVIA